MPLFGGFTVINALRTLKPGLLNIFIQNIQDYQRTIKGPHHTVRPERETNFQAETPNLF